MKKERNILSKYKVISKINLMNIRGGQSRTALRNVELPWFSIFKNRHKR